MRYAPQPEPFWPVIRRNWREVAFGLAAFALIVVAVAIALGPVLRIAGAVLLADYLLVGGR